MKLQNRGLVTTFGVPSGGGGGGGSPGGDENDVQINVGDAFFGSDNLEFDDLTLSVTAAINQESSSTPEIFSRLTGLSGPTSVSVFGGYAYVINIISSTLTIIDITRPAVPKVVSTLTDASTMTGSINAKATGHYVYIAATGGAGVGRLSIVDVSDKTSPTVVGFVTTTGDNSTNVFVVGQYAYVCELAGALSIIDISDPTNPIEVSYLTILNAADCLFIIVSDVYAYISASTGLTITIIDVSDPNNPVQVGQEFHAQLDGASDMKINGSLLTVACDNTNRITMVDISDPTSPSIAGTSGNIPELTDATGVDISGQFAYVAANDGCTIMDIRDPTNITLVGVIIDSGMEGATAITLIGGLALVLGFNGNEMVIINIRGTQLLSAFIGNIVTDKLEVLNESKFGGPVYAETGLSVGGTANVDVLAARRINSRLLQWNSDLNEFNLAGSLTHSHDPTNPPTLFSTLSVAASALDLAINGSYAYMTENGDTVYTADISDPTQPVLVNTTAISGAAGKSRIVNYGRFTYYLTAGAATNRMHVLDSSDPVNLVDLGTVDLLNADWETPAISGRFMYVPYLTVGGIAVKIQVFDLLNPEIPLSVKEYENAGIDGCRRLLVIHSGTVLLVSGEDTDNVLSIDITDPLNPTELDSISVADDPEFLAPWGMVAHRHNIYVALADSPGSGIASIDVRDPSNLMLDQVIIDDNSFDLPRFLDIAGDYMYVSGNTPVKNLVVVDISTPSDMTILNSLSNSFYDSSRGIRIQGGFLFNFADNGTDELTVTDLKAAKTPGGNLGSIKVNDIIATGSVDISRELCVGQSIAAIDYVTAGQGFTTPGFYHDLRPDVFDDAREAVAATYLKPGLMHFNSDRDGARVAVGFGGTFVYASKPADNNTVYVRSLQDLLDAFGPTVDDDLTITAIVSFEVTLIQLGVIRLVMSPGAVLTAPNPRVVTIISTNPAQAIIAQGTGINGFANISVINTNSFVAMRLDNPGSVYILEGLQQPGSFSTIEIGAFTGVQIEASEFIDGQIIFTDDNAATARFRSMGNVYIATGATSIITALTDVTLGDMEFSAPQFTLPNAGGIGIDFDDNNTVARGSIIGGQVLGLGSATNGFDHTSNAWLMNNVDGIPDSFNQINIEAISMGAGGSTNIPATGGVWTSLSDVGVEIQWDVNDTPQKWSNSDGDTGQATYNGVRAVTNPITGFLSFEGQGSDLVSFGIGIDGAPPSTGHFVTVTTTNTQRSTLTTPMLPVDLVPGRTVELMFMLDNNSSIDFFQAQLIPAT